MSEMERTNDIPNLQPDPLQEVASQVGNCSRFVTLCYLAVTPQRYTPPRLVPDRRHHARRLSASIRPVTSPKTHPSTDAGNQRQQRTQAYAPGEVP